MEFQAFLTSLGTSFLIFVVLMLLFTWLSRKPGNYVVYYSNRILKGMDPIEGGKRTRNPFAWIREAVSTTEADIISISGVDSAVYFVFLTTVLSILFFSGIVLLPVLLPVAATDRSLKVSKDTNTSQGSFNNLDKLSMGHVGDKNPRLWAFLAATYWVSFLVYFFLWKACKHVLCLRATALMTSDVRAEQFAIIVRDIPKPTEGQTRKEQVDSYFQKIYPDSFYRSMVVTDNKEVNKIYEELGGFKKKLARAEAIYAESKNNNPEGGKPSHKVGFCGLLGKKVDSIEYYNEKINELTPKLETEQKVTLREKQKSAALVFFTNRVAAVSASQSLHAQMADHWTVTDATEPRQIIWTNLTKNFYERIICQYVIYIVVFFTIFFYMIPITFISAITTLDNLKKYLPFTKAIVDQTVVKTVLEAYLPQLALIVFLALLPRFLVFLSKAEGIPSVAHVIRAASGKYFYFTVLNVFIGVTLGSTLFETLKQIEHKPKSIINVLAESLPKSATFFLTYVALKSFVGNGLVLSRLIPLIIFHLKRKYLCKTEAEVKAAWAPGDLGYATRFPGDMLVLTIVLCYSVMAPVIIPFGVLYFGLGWLVLRNQVLKVYVPSYESYGRMWPHIFTRVIAALLLYQVTMVGFVGVKKFPYAPILIPLPIISLIYSYIFNKKFYQSFQSTALEVASNDLKEIPNMDHIYRSFIPAPLSAGKSDDDQYGEALSIYSNLLPRPDGMLQAST